MVPDGPGLLVSVSSREHGWGLVMDPDTGSLAQPGSCDGQTHLWDVGPERPIVPTFSFSLSLWGQNLLSRGTQWSEGNHPMERPWWPTGL